MSAKLYTGILNTLYDNNIQIFCAIICVVKKQNKPTKSKILSFHFFSYIIQSILIEDNSYIIVKKSFQPVNNQIYNNINLILKSFAGFLKK